MKMRVVVSEFLQHPGFHRKFGVAPPDTRIVVIDSRSAQPQRLKRTSFGLFMHKKSALLQAQQYRTQQGEYSTELVGNHSLIA